MGTEEEETGVKWQASKLQHGLLSKQGWTPSLEWSHNPVSLAVRPQGELNNNLLWIKI